MCVQFVSWIVNVCPADFAVMSTDGKGIHTGKSSGDRVIIDVQRDTSWWIQRRSCWEDGVSAGKSMVIVLGLNEEEGRIAVIVG